MAIKWYAGNRTQGTNAERLALTTGGADGLGSNGNATNQDTTLDTTNEKLGTGCLDFNGSNQFINMTNLLTNTAMTTAGTIAFWIRFDAVENGKKIFMFGDSNGTASDLYMEIESDLPNAKIMCGCDLGGTAQWAVRMATGLLSAGTWFHIALTHNGTRPYIYLNGVDQTTTQVTTDLTKWVSGLSGLDNFNWGRVNHNNAAEAYVDGKFDDIGIWNTALPIGANSSAAGSIKYLYNGGTGRLVSTILPGLRAYYNCDSANNPITNNVPTASYPNYPNGTIHEESDTGTHYMWNGSNAWNVVG